MQLKKTPIILTVLAIITLSVLGWYVARPQGSLEFALAPNTMTLTIDKKDQTITHKQVLKLTPGTYEATFSRDGFQTETKAIVVEDKKSNRVVMALTPITDAAKKLLSESTESQKVVKEYEQVKYQELIASLPLSGVNYTVTSCPSVKYPKTDKKALCITAETPEGEAAAKNKIKDFGYNLASLEILTGTENIKAVITRDSYRIDYYSNVKQETDSDKLALFITPLNVPFVPYSTQKNPELEAIKSAALADLKDNGYALDKYAIYYSNVYLSQYNPDVDIADEHAMPPFYQ
jgi:hypothetical protein